MKLDDLQKPLADMSTEELRQLMLAIRKDRRVSKAAAKPKARREKAKKADTLQALLASLTPEEREALLKQIEE